MVKVPDKILRTFDIQNCRALCEKLDRELERLRAAGDDRLAAGDHALNFAMTAWHLIDWVWVRSQEGELEFKGELVPIAAGWKTLGDARAYFLKECWLLAYCDVITTEVKHSGLEPKPHRPDFVIEASSRSTFASQQEPGVLLGNLLRSKWKIVDEKGRHELIERFETIHSFWTEFIYGNTTEK